MVTDKKKKKQIYKGNIPPRYLGERILYLRKTKGITRPQLIEYTGISNASLSRLEDNPNASISVQTILKLSQLFHVSCDYLLSGNEYSNNENVGNEKLSVISQIYDNPQTYELITTYNTLSSSNQNKVLQYIELLKTHKKGDFIQ